MHHECSMAVAGVPARALLCAAIGAALATNARAALLTVTNGNDSGAGSLRSAVAAASPGDVIRVPPGALLTLTSGQISITQDLVIEAPFVSTTLDAGRHGRLFNVGSGANVALMNLVLTRGLVYGNGGDHDKAGGAAAGGAIANAGTLSLANVAMTANAVAGGGAGGCTANLGGSLITGAGGGGGGGFTGIGGGNGGSGTYAGSAGGNGSGGDGGNAYTGVFATQGGAGGSLTGGSSGGQYGYAGKTAALAGIGSIGGGGSGQSANLCPDVASSRGGNAAGGLYNASSGNVVAFGGSYFKNNLAAAGGSAGGALPAGLAAGAAYNKGHFSIAAGGAAASTTNAGAGRTGSSNTFVNDGGVQNLAYAIATPTIANLGGDSVQYTQGDAAIYLDSGIDANLTDADAPNFFGGHVTARISANSSAADVLGLANQGTGAGQVGVSGSVVTYGGSPIGALGTVGSSQLLLITFSSTANASVAAVQAVLRALTYANSNTSNPSLLPRTVQVTVDDGHGGTTATANVTVNVASSIGLSVTDNANYTAYGQTVPYTVTLSNTGLGTASGLSVSSTYPSGLDGANAQWTCVPANGATCNAGAGTFADTATLPPQSSATWTVNVPVPLDAAAPTAEIDVSATGATGTSDVDTLVIFRDGIDGP